MKINLKDFIEIDELKYPNLSKAEIKKQVQGIFNGYMQALEDEANNLLADQNAEAK
ncbi:hypothetical protein [Paenibacillus tianjinensis]|uniref:Uncharacterized protein n=1 Tax=Paenibacillus tianjinensis TaxID=2810347 RepID=A0ABX7L687_9BACL|nr:hypothetical protein [Paenibacillus tianjinensis]QSF43494.1 hypothetical protein JRJ22_19720 [Paenibacillus tianjinensis]